MQKKQKTSNPVKSEIKRLNKEFKVMYDDLSSRRYSEFEYKKLGALADKIEALQDKLRAEKLLKRIKPLKKIKEQVDSKLFDSLMNSLLKEFGKFESMIEDASSRRSTTPTFYTSRGDTYSASDAGPHLVGPSGLW